MNINISQKRINDTDLVVSLIKDLQRDQVRLKLEDANLYYEFPVYKDLDQEVIVAELLLVSKKHGIFLFHISDLTKEDELIYNADLIAQSLDNLYSILFTRLLRNRALRKDKTTLKFPIRSICYAPIIDNTSFNDIEDVITVTKYPVLGEVLKEKITNEIDEGIFAELISTIEGAKGLIKPNVRENVERGSKGDAVNSLEKEIAKFDQYQKTAYAGTIMGVNRIRGLAGSGKTVVLAIKAAITHLKYPEAKIAYTFYTKSLYQHIQRLITRFYRQFDDKDPNWDNLEILHAWGSAHQPGFYYNSCLNNQIRPLTFSEAVRSSKDAFDSACTHFLQNVGQATKVYDYVFIDEGQDFASSFIKLCIEVTKAQKVILAYDELQTIFQVHAPTPKEIFGQDKDGNAKINFEEDVILYKCYRNPREILVVAHALGFGLYGKKILQMIESVDYWNDIGYNVVNGSLAEGEEILIERPEENSLASISKSYNIDEIIKSSTFPDYNSEITEVASLIKKDIDSGLLPEDILVITVDDRNASGYLSDLQDILARNYKIYSNNIHADKFSIKDFQTKNHVTLSTVHKAKGNESYSVYVVGVDALFALDPTVRERNILFTAITRSKGWVHITGVGDAAQICHGEIQTAKENFPYLKFKYPSIKDIKIMQRGTQESAIRKSKAKQTLESLLNELSPEEIERFLNQRAISKKSNDR
jgi:superfamily I DNA and RNA helicase